MAQEDGVDDARVALAESEREWTRRLSNLSREQIMAAVANVPGGHRFGNVARRRRDRLLEEASSLTGAHRTALETAIRELENGGSQVQMFDEDWISRLDRLSRPQIMAALRGYDNLGLGRRGDKRSLLERVSMLEGPFRVALEAAVNERERGGHPASSNVPGPRIRENGGRRGRRRRHASLDRDGDEDDEGREENDRPLTTAERVLAAIDSYNPNIDKFMELPSEEDVQYRHERYRNATSNDALAQCVCVCCAREVWRREAQEVLLSSLKCKDRLRPWKAHPAHKLVDGMLLVEDKLRETPEGPAGMFCDDCFRKLRSKKTPPLSLANNMWIGDVPEEIQCLTVPEQMLIALHYPRCFVFKLFPKNRGVGDPESLQRGMVGNVTTYTQNADEVAKMLEGKLMPRPPRLLACVIAVSFIGLGKLPKKWLKGTFRVRRAVVHDALRWLKANNPMYEDIEISEEALNVLPEDGIPDAILANVRQEESDSIAQRERESYVPGDDDVDEAEVRAPQNAVAHDAPEGEDVQDSGREAAPVEEGDEEDDGEFIYHETGIDFVEQSIRRL